MRIASVLDSDFEDSEFQQPYDEFRRAGHEVVVIGFEKGSELRGKQGKVTIRTDLAIGEARPNDYDALFIAGG